MLLSIISRSTLGSAHRFPSLRPAGETGQCQALGYPNALRTVGTTARNAALACHDARVAKRRTDEVQPTGKDRKEAYKTTRAPETVIGRGGSCSFIIAPSGTALFEHFLLITSSRPALVTCSLVAGAPYFPRSPTRFQKLLGRLRAGRPQPGIRSHATYYVACGGRPRREGTCLAAAWSSWTI